MSNTCALGVFSNRFCSSHPELKVRITTIILIALYSKLHAIILSIELKIIIYTIPSMIIVYLTNIRYIIYN